MNLSFINSYTIRYFSYLEFLFDAHLFEQNLTVFQFKDHFFLHVKGLLHTGHTLDGKFSFLVINKEI